MPKLETLLKEIPPQTSKFKLQMETLFLSGNKYYFEFIYPGKSRRNLFSFYPHWELPSLENHYFPPAYNGGGIF